MKLSKVYSNRNAKFRPILFKEGLNVLYARVTRPKDSAKDSHNLGKTLLISLIDFLLLGGFGKGHFLYDHSDLFAKFVFFLEIQLNSGGYVTVRRSVEENSKISFKLHDTPDQDYSGLPDKAWDQSRVSFKKARDTLNSYLGLTAIQPANYRKGVSYFLRRQADYQDVFQIGKFSQGRHAEWKPYLAALLGFSRELLERKYAIDDKIEDKKESRKNYSQEVRSNPAEYDRIKGLIEIKRKEVDQAKQEIDKFNFYETDLNINTTLVNRIESEIEALNEEIYEIKYEVQKIRESLGAKIQFDLRKVKQVFEEAGVYFPDSLTRDYGELLEFNERLTEGRNRRLSNRLDDLLDRQKVAKSSLANLNQEREQILATLQIRDTFEKFRRLQAGVIEQEVEIARLQAELENLDAMSRIDREIRVLTQERQEVVNKIEDEVNAGNATYSAIRQRFNEIIRKILNLPALVSTSVNAQGNLEFDATLVQDDKSLHATSEGEGTSYKKLLCAAFDIAVLEVYSSRSFYRFAYHDGILEGLDNRKKMKVLEVVDEFCLQFGLQYILTIIDADLPRNEHDQKVVFPEEVVVREFHEMGPEGRLFNMPTF